jgi:hypothetical protein
MIHARGPALFIGDLWPARQGGPEGPPYKLQAELQACVLRPARLERHLISSHVMPRAELNRA